MTSNTQGKQVKIFQRIVFQNTAINLIMLILFIITIVLAGSSMKSIINMALTASTNEVDLLIQEAKLKQDTLAIDGGIAALLGATGLSDTDPANYEVYFETIALQSSLTTAQRNSKLCKNATRTGIS
ncbi:MAG: hypothetical protein IJJ64_09115 [Butyrivibrio sp.]|nr:hypothetical protein [Butyrivibrio sp.]